MLDVGSVVDTAAAGAGFMAASIAVGGFVAHAKPALSEQPDHKLRYATVVGGLCGLAIAVLLIAGSILVSKFLSASG